MTNDGKTAMSVAADGTIAAWDLILGTPKKPPQKSVQPIQLVAISPDGVRALIAFRSGVVQGTPIAAHVEKMPTGTFLGYGAIANSNRDGMANKADDAVRALAVSADHKLGLIGGVNGKLFMVDMSPNPPTAEAKKLKPLVGHQETVLAVLFSPTAGFAASGGGGVLQVGKLIPGKDNTVHMWNMTSLTEEWKGEGHTNSIVSLAFSADGSLLASGSVDGEIRVWNAANGTLLATFPGHTGKILGMAFSADNKKLWSGAADRTLRQWKLP